mmetsp:Transcript_60773/g.143587  ORF Transcript_60773/g.143587 Transcript_60773/m.143587 type:complete len:334 (+) Transcript_60773:130-1131(+)
MLTGLHKNFRFPFPSPACLSGEKCQFDSFAWLFSKSDLFLWDPQTFWLVKVTIKTFNLVSQSSWERKDGAEPKSLIPSRSSKALMHISHRVASARSCPPPVRGRLPCSSLYLGKLQLALCPVSPVSAARALSSQGSFSSTVNKRIQISTTALTHCTTPHHTTPHHTTSLQRDQIVCPFVWTQYHRVPCRRVVVVVVCLSLCVCHRCVVCCCHVFVVIVCSLSPCLFHRVFVLTVCCGFVVACLFVACLLSSSCLCHHCVFLVVVCLSSACRAVCLSIVITYSLSLCLFSSHVCSHCVYCSLSGCVPHTAQSAPRCLLVSPAGTTADCSAHSVW